MAAIDFTLPSGMLILGRTAEETQRMIDAHNNGLPWAWIFGGVMLLVAVLALDVAATCLCSVTQSEAAIATALLSNEIKAPLCALGQED